MSDQLEVGTHWVDAPCPRCGGIEVIAVTLSTVLTVPTDDTPSLRVKARAKPVDHSCGQATINLRTAAGLLTGGGDTE